MSKGFDLQLITLRLKNCHPQRIQAVKVNPFLIFLAAHDFSSFRFPIPDFIHLTLVLKLTK